MKYVYGKKMRSFKDRLMSGLAIILMVASNSAMAMPILLSSHASADSLPEVVYDALPSVEPATNYVSEAFQATSTYEFGDQVHLGGSNRLLDTVTVTFSNWAVASNADNQAFCGNHPEKCPAGGYIHPITVKVYNTNSSDPSLPGPELASTTENVFVPWRPEPFSYNGIAFNAAFDFSSQGVTLPDDVIVSVVFDTQTHGYSPLGEAGPYNSLNVAVPTDQPVSVGSDDSTDETFVYSTWVGGYSGSDPDGDGGPTGVFRRSTTWTPYGTVAMQISAKSTQPTGVINTPTASQNFAPGSVLGLNASYDDHDAANDDVVQWAVRKGTCAANSGSLTVAGNVDGKNNTYTWNGADFSASVNTTGWEEGQYCFVFNPTDDQGQNDVRETQLFTISRFTQAACSANYPWAGYVVANNQGTTKGGSAVLPERSVTGKALGEADGDFYSLGQHGDITLEFNGYVLDAPGNDLVATEITNGPYPAEGASVYVSQNGTDWTFAWTFSNNGGVGGTSGADFGWTGLEWIKYVRITDVTDYTPHAANADGFDLDALTATSITCERPSGEVKGDDTEEEPDEELPEPCTAIVPSNGSTRVGQNPAKILSWVHPNWVAEPEYAEWIWSDDPVADTLADTTHTFTKTFTWAGPVNSAAIQIAADNNYTLWVNGDLVGNGTDAFGSLTSYDIADKIIVGLNTITVEVTNRGVSGSTADSNPAGLLFKASLEGEGDCVPEQPGGGGHVLGDEDLNGDGQSDGDPNTDTNPTPTSVGRVLAESTLVNTGYGIAVGSFIGVVAIVIAGLLYADSRISRKKEQN